MTRRPARGKKKSRGGFRAALLLVAAVVIGAALTWVLRGWRRTTGPPAAPTPSAPARAAPPRTSAAMPADFESVDRRAGAGVVAVVLDDLGYDERALETLARWDAPLALAVIPSAPLAGRAAVLAKEKGWDLLVHLPMEPESGPSEAETIGTRDSDETIRARVLAALAKMAGAIGINNHQGSKATADPRVVRAVLGVVREKGLFFLDSRTTNASVAGAEALALHVPFLVRDVFLDDVAAEAAAKGGAPDALDTAWGHALALATKSGQAIVIGHPRRDTLAFLGPKLAGMVTAEGPKPIRVSELVP